MTEALRTLEPAELAADPAVQAYVLHGERAAEWEAWLAQHPEAAVRMLAAQRMLLGLSRDLRDLDAADRVADAEVLDRVWAGIDARTGATTQGGASPAAKVVGLRAWVRNRQWGRVAAAAAAAVAALVVAFVYLGRGDIYATANGEVLAVTLPDGSRVTLAPESSLRVRDFGDGERRVMLRGEGFFEVERGTPFTVETTSGTVSVLGTSFEVDAVEQGLAVAVATGRVRVASGDEAVELTPGQAVRGGEGGLEPVAEVDLGSIGAFRGARIVLRDAPLDEVAETLERYYPRAFEVEAAARGRRVTLDLPADDFPAAMGRLGFVLGRTPDTSATWVRLR